MPVKTLKIGVLQALFFDRKTHQSHSPQIACFLQFKSRFLDDVGLRKNRILRRTQKREKQANK